MTGNPRNAMVCATPYLQNEFGDPPYHFLLAVKVLKKSVRGKFLGANVLNAEFPRQVMNFPIESHD